LGLRAGRIFQKHGFNKIDRIAPTPNKSENNRNQTFSTLQTTLQGTLLTVREKNRLIGHKKAISMMGFDPEGQTITTGSSNFVFKRWNAVTGELLKTLSLAECKQDMACEKVISSSTKARSVIPSCLLGQKDRAIEIVSKDNKTVKLLNAATGKPLYINDFEIPIGSVASSPNCQIFSSAGEKDLSTFEFGYGSNTIDPSTPSNAGNTIDLWKRDTTERLATLKSHKQGISMVVFSPDGKTIASASEDGIVKLWNWDVSDRIKPFHPGRKEEDLESLMNKACEWAGNYLRHSKDVKQESDRKLCDDIKK
jgi:WD40 repeat protein